MSITALVDEDVIAKDPAFRQLRLQPMVDRHVAELATKFHLDPEIASALRGDLVPLAAERPIEKTNASNALDALTRYIPTEVVTLYLAALAAMPSILTTFPTR